MRFLSIVSHLFIDLWLGVPDGNLKVTVAIVAPLVEEGVHLLCPVTWLSMIFFIHPM